METYPLPELNDALIDQYRPIQEKVAQLMPEEEWLAHLPWIEAINQRKKEIGAVILAHNYQTPEIFYGVADITGDSLALAQKATEVDARIIIQCGVHFMAETSKILNPEKTVIIPDESAGCSLADSITAEGLRALKARYPGVPVVSYVNTTAEVKAETDVCCTSANAIDIVNALPDERVIFTPDRYLGQHVANHTDKEIILWDGSCEVHEQFTGEQVRRFREESGAFIIAHPECPQDVLAEADYIGSTSGMIRHIASHQPQKVALITECSMSDNVSAQFPHIQFTRPCNLCPHMKRISLRNILASLHTLQPEVQVDEATARKARRAVERMLEMSRKPAEKAA